MPQNKRFEALAKKLGFTIHPVCGVINGKWQRRPDILCVERHGEHQLTIPKKMYALPNPGHRDLIGIQHPDFFECENKLYAKKTGYIYA